MQGIWHFHLVQYRNVGSFKMSTWHSSSNLPAITIVVRDVIFVLTGFHLSIGHGWCGYYIIKLLRNAMKLKYCNICMYMVINKTKESTPLPNRVPYMGIRTRKGNKTNISRLVEIFANTLSVSSLNLEPNQTKRISFLSTSEQNKEAFCSHEHSWFFRFRGRFVIAVIERPSWIFGHLEHDKADGWFFSDSSVVGLLTRV